MTDQTNAIVPAEGSKLTLGQTNLRSEDLVLPRIKVVQQMSKEAADKKAEVGDFYNTLTGETYGKTLVIQPILSFMQRIFLVRQERREKADRILEAEGMEALSDGDGLKCRSFDMFEGKGEPGIECNLCPLSKWTKGAKGEQVPPLCTETYNVAASNEIGELVIVSFSRSSARVGKRFFSAIRIGGQVAPWTKLYELQTHEERNDQGIFWVPDFRISADRPAPELIKQAVYWAGELAGVRVDAIDVTPDDESTRGGVEDDDAGKAGDDPF